MQNTSRTDRRNNDFDTLDQPSYDNNDYDFLNKKNIIITYDRLIQILLIFINLLYVAYFSYYGYIHLSNEWSTMNVQSFALYVGIIFIPNLLCTILILNKKYFKCIFSLMLLNIAFTVVTIVLILAYYCDKNSITKTMDDNYFKPYILIGCLIYELCMFILYIKIYNKIEVISNIKLMQNLTSPRNTFVDDDNHKLNTFV